jgi:hypothetical protein
MSETPIFTVPEYQGRLTDREIENRVTEAESRGDFDLWEDEITPPIWDGPDFTRHEDVQPLNPQQVEAQPSIVEQHNRMTDAQNVAYIGAITPYVAAHRDATIRQNLPVYRSDYALGA